MSQSANELYRLGRKSFERGDYQRAIGWYEQAASQARRAGESSTELNALEGVLVCWSNISDYQKAAETATNLLARARQLQNKEYEMGAILRLCYALANIDLRSRWREIRPLMLDGLAMARRLGNNYFEIYHLMRLGGSSVEMGEEQPGYAWLQEALNTIGPKTEQAPFLRKEIYEQLSYLMRQREDYAEAVRYAEMAVGAAKQHGNPQFVAGARLVLARAERARGELGAALEIAEEVLAQAQKRGWKGHEQEAEYLRGEIERVLGHPDVAVAAARRALALVQEIGLKEGEVEAMLSLGQALQALGEKEEALAVWRRARRLSQERNYEDHFNKADALLQGAS